MTQFKVNSTLVSLSQNITYSGIKNAAIILAKNLLTIILDKKLY